MEALEALENMQDTDQTCGETEPVKDKEESHDNDKQAGENHYNTDGDDDDITENEPASVTNDEEPMLQDKEASVETDKEESQKSKEDDGLENPSIVDLKSDSKAKEDAINNISKRKKLRVIVGGELVSDSPATDTSSVEKSPVSPPTSESNGWECKTCTYVNLGRARKCKMCGSKE